MRRTAGFSRRKRLTNSTEFGWVFAYATRSSDKYFTVLSRANNLPTARLGLTVSRRVAKHAVDRNRLKRLSREVFRCQQALPSLDFVVLANKAAPGADNAELRSSLERHLTRLAKQAG
ncbi:MAG: ribonuclease P protein component [Candidatus Rariloculaceae bacterium]